MKLSKDLTENKLKRWCAPIAARRVLGDHKSAQPGPGMQAFTPNAAGILNAIEKENVAILWQRLDVL
jgi:hypothetical protein